MKTGIILYVLGNETTNLVEDTIARVAKKLIPGVDRIEIVSNDHGHWDISDAWWTLIVKGMHQIICAQAEYTKDDGLRLTGRNMRLTG